MAFEITDHRKEAMFTSDRALYLTADKSEVVEEDDPRAAFLLVAAGSELDEREAKRYGLTSEPDEAPPESEPEAEEPVVEPEPTHEPEAEPAVEAEPEPPKTRRKRASKAEDKQAKPEGDK